MKAVADTSSLLSLEFMGVLDEALDIADIYTTAAVEEELKEMAGFSDEKSRIARSILKLIGDGKIKSFTIKRELRSKYISMNSCLALCISGKIPILITDDAHTAYYLRKTALQKGIKIRICVAILMELVRSGRISLPDARDRLEELMKKRGWESGVLEVLVKRYMEEDSEW